MNLYEVLGGFMSNIVKIKEYHFSEKMIRAKDLSKIFVGISQATYEGWARQGIITRYKIGGSIFYKLSEIERIIENSKEVV